MPEMHGPTLLNELRRHDPKVKIIFVCGYTEEVVLTARLGEAGLVENNVLQAAGRK